MKNIRVGLGFDIHRLKSKRKLILGGVDIVFPAGLEGHSDGDVLLHAICDAILGAIGERDIGYFFPNSDTRYKDISSLVFIKKTMAIMEKARFKIKNLDSVIICDAPKIAPYVKRMKEKISKALKLKKTALAIKATTTEGILAFSGKGVAAYCVVLLEQRNI